MLSDCPTIMIGYFNVNMLTKTFVSTIPQTFMTQYHLKIIFYKPTTIYDNHLDHIWTNARTQQSCFGSTQMYWIDHKLIYFTFKLPNFTPRFVPHLLEHIYPIICIKVGPMHCRCVVFLLTHTLHIIIKTIYHSDSNMYTHFGSFF